MTPPGALAVTAGLMAVAALILAVIADERRDTQPYAGLAWCLFSAALIAGAASAWMEALS